MAVERPLSSDVGTRLLFEDERTRVWLLELEPGAATAWHEHDCDYVFVVTGTGHVRCEYVDGSVEDQDTDALGSTQYRPRDTPHRLVNIGSATYQNVVVELKGVGGGDE